MIAAILERYYRLNAVAVLTESEKLAVGARLWVLIENRGLPEEEMGDAEKAAEMAEEEVAPLVAQILDGLAEAERLKTPLRQLVKACFQAPRRTCRDSYREAVADGVCRRQELERARKRVSGTHCVDCPYWTKLTPGQHEKFLAKAWRPGRAMEFAAHREVFLPEDFRALQVLLDELRDG